MNKKHILLIDDNIEELILLKLQIESFGFDVTVATNGIQALDLFNKQAFDLVVTDIFMPEIDGLEIIQTILSLDPTTKIIAISDSYRTIGRRYLNAAKLMGATCCFTKPIEIQALGDTLQELLKTNTKKVMGPV